MREVTCSACNNYDVIYEHTTDMGFCLLRKGIVLDLDRVCEEFVIRKGLHTKREIPAHCKNYHNTK